MLYDKTIKIRINEKTLKELDNIRGDMSRSRKIRQLITLTYKNERYIEWLKENV